MPDTQITVARNARALAFIAQVPLSELLLTLPPEMPNDARLLLGNNMSVLRAYFVRHVHLSTGDGVRVPLAIRSIRLNRERDANVGSYAELQVTITALIGGQVPVSLAYDAVLHRVANHRALVTDSSGRSIGTVRYRLRTKSATPIGLPAADAVAVAPR